ncbi:MAG: PQQ-binding-like beta-propeller repeat protein, partial [Acidobacteria bacterium]|nr:PQQ-binding-like beta-propeller repeat protein [Acidobacteriota bacterium]
MMKAQGTFDWRFSESPLVDGDRVIVSPGAREAALVALKADSGEEIWRAAIPSLGPKGTDGAGYSSVVISKAGGVKQYVQLLGRGVVGIDAAKGKFLWGYNPVANDIANIPTPLIHGDLVFASSGYGTGAALLRLKRMKGGAVTAEEVYFLKADTFQNHHGGMILHEGHVYSGTGHNRGFPMSVELASGAVNWGPIRNDGKSSAAVTYADGNLYFRYQNGLMLLVEATPTEYREKGSFMIPDVKRESWPHPVIANGKLLLREQGKLYAYDVKKPEQPPKEKAPATPPAKAPAKPSNG